MCGIAGFTTVSDAPNAQTALQRMTGALAHRGPDAAGHFINKNISLGHRRLSIIDLDAAANQPFTDKSGRYTIVYNGEIYNFAELRASLKNYCFRTNSDTEVLLAAYIERGADCLSALNGMFAFAIWDEAEQQLFVARDRIGKKPLYYFHDKTKLVFASEIRALLDSKLVPPVLDKFALSEYLQFNSLAAPLTLIKNVKILRQGSYGIYRNGEFTEKQYWSLVKRDDQRFADSYNAAAKNVRELLQSAVEQRLIADVPLRAFLSGGIDSSAIVALMATVSSAAVNTFSVVFDEAEYDESVYSTLIAKKFKTAHQAVRLTAPDFLDFLPSALAAMDTPTADGINTFVIAAAARRGGCAVALSGVGGDELFAGYPVFEQYSKIRRAAALYRLPQGLRKAVGSAAGALLKDHKSERRQQLAGLPSTRFEDLYPVFRGSYSRSEAAALLELESEPVNQLLRAFTLQELSCVQALPEYAQVTVGELSTYTLNLLLRDADQMSMRHALEIRAPFLDYKLIEYVLRIPDKFKKGSTPKKLLTDALENLLPREIIDRPKMGFSFPWNEWLRGELKEFCSHKIHKLQKTGLFNARAVAAVWQRFLDKSPQITWLKVWQLVVLSDWIERNRINAE